MPNNPYVNIGQNPLAYSDPFGDTTVNPIQQVAKEYQSLLEQQGSEDLARRPDFMSTVQTPAETISMTSGEIPAALQGRLTTVGKRLVSEGAKDTKKQLEKLYAEQGIQPQYTDTDGSMYAYNPLTGEYQKYYEPPSKGEQFLSAVAKAAPVAIATGGLGSALSTGLGVSAATGNALANTLVAAAQGKDVGDIAKAAALSYAGGNIGDRIAAGTEFGINPFGEQAGMLADQTAGLDKIYGFLPTTAGTTAAELIKGKNLEDALISGALGGLRTADLGGETPSFDIQTPQILKDIEKAVVRPAGEALAALDKNVLQSVTKPIAEAAQYVDDQYIDPFVSTVKDTLDPLQEAGREFDQAVLQPVKDTLVDMGEAVGDALPDINLPNIDWKGLFGALLGGSQGMFSGGGTGAPMAQQDAIQTELLDYKPITPYRSKLSPSARLFG
jgi:hypothetical protein